MIPLPFSFAIACASIAVFTSKLQYPPTHLLLALHSISSPLCLAATYRILAQALANPTSLLIVISIGLFGALNLIGTAAQTCIFAGDAKFTRWIRAGSQKPNFSIYGMWLIFVTIIAALGAFQFQNIIFCRLFNFSCFKAQLKSIQLFRVSHLLNFLAYAPQIIIVYTVATALQNVSTYSLIMILIDALATTIVNMVLALFVSRKDDSFFSEMENGLHINKVTCLHGDDNTLVYMQESQNKIKSLPDILEFDEFGLCTTKRNRSRKRSTKKVSQQSNAAINCEQQGVQDEESKIDKTQSVEANTQSELQLKQKQDDQNLQIVDNAGQQGMEVGANNEELVDRNSERYQTAVVKIQTLEAASYAFRELKPPNIMIIQEDYVEESEIQSEKQEQILQNHSIVKEEPLVFSGLETKAQINPKAASRVSQLQKPYDQVSFQSSANKIDKNFELLINQQALLESESQFTNAEAIKRQFQNQQLLNQEQVKAIFKKTVSKHRSPQKMVNKDDKQQLIFQKRNHNFAKINEPNSQIPIKQKNLRGRENCNHPIQKQQSNYPLNRGKVFQEYFCIDDSQSNRQTKRQKLKAPKSTLDYNHYGQTSEISETNLKNYTLQANLIKAETSDCKKFTRSNFKSMIGLFTKLKKNDACQSEIMTIDIPPQQPTRDSTSSVSPGSHLANLFRRNGVRSAPKGRIRPQTSKEKEVVRRFNQEKRLGAGQQSKKMNSLEKIYLQRLSNF